MNDKKTEFKVSIDDGYCEWTYPINLDENFSISTVYSKICEGLEIKEDSKNCYVRKVYKDKEA